MTKYIFVTGGVVSSLGKGVFTPNFEHEFSMMKETILALL